MNLTGEQLIQHLRAEFDAANSLLLRQFILTFLISIPAVLSILIENVNWLYLLAILNFFMLLTWWRTNLSYQKFRQASLAARRGAMILNGLGGTLHPAITTDLKERFTVDLSKVPPMDTNSYYCSQEPFGSKRLAELIEESAFYSSRTHEFSAKVMLGIVVGFLAIFIVALFCAIPIATNAFQTSLTRVFLAATVFFLSSDVLGRALAHKCASKEIKRVQQRCRMEEDGQLAETDVLILLQDYISAMESAPETVPHAFRGKLKEKIADAWKDYQSSKLSS